MTKLRICVVCPPNPRLEHFPASVFLHTSISAPFVFHHRPWLYRSGLGPAASKSHPARTAAWTHETPLTLRKPTTLVSQPRTRSSSNKSDNLAQELTLELAVPEPASSTKLVTLLAWHRKILGFGNLKLVTTNSPQPISGGASATL